MSTATVQYVKSNRHTWMNPVAYSRCSCGFILLWSGTLRVPLYVRPGDPVIGVSRFSLEMLVCINCSDLWKQRFTGVSRHLFVDFLRHTCIALFFHGQFPHGHSVPPPLADGQFRDGLKPHLFTQAYAVEISRPRTRPRTCKTYGFRTDRNHQERRENIDV